MIYHGVAVMVSCMAGDSLFDIDQDAHSPNILWSLLCLDQISHAEDVDGKAIIVQHSRWMALQES